MRFSDSRGRQRVRKYLIAGGILFVLLILFGFFGLPPILKSVLEKNLTQALHRETSVAEVRFNPFTLGVTLKGFRVKEPQGKETFLSFDEMYLNLQAMSVLRLGPILGEFRLVKPYIRLVRKPDASYNFSDLLPQPAAQAQEQPTSKPLRFSVNNIQIMDGSAEFWDQPFATKHSIKAVNVALPFVSNIPYYVQTFVEPGISAEVNGTTYRMEGKTKPFADSRETEFQIRINDLDLPFYLGYLPKDRTFEVPSGRLDAKLTLVFIQRKEGTQSLTVTGDAGLRELGIDDRRKNPVLRLPGLQVVIAPTEPLARKIHLAKVTVQSPELTVSRDKTGATNLESLVPPRETQAAEAAPADPSTQVSFLVDTIELTEGAVRFSDLSNPLPFKAALAPIQFSAEQVTNAPDKKGSFSLRVQSDAKEEVGVTGEITIQPLTAAGSVEVKGVPLKRYAPYYTDLVEFDIADARMDLSARYEYAMGDQATVTKVTGLSVALKSLRLRERNATEDFLAVPAFSIGDTEINLGERLLRLGQVSTRGGKLSVTREKGGEVYLLRLFRPRTSATAAPGPAKPATEEKPWRVELGRLALDQYTMIMRDQRPSVPTTVVAEQIRVAAERLSTAGKTPGRVSVSLLLDKAATLALGGNLLLESPRMDGTLEIKNLPLKPYAPYYRDLILFTVEDGSLSLSTTFRYVSVPDGLPQVRLSGLAAALSSLRLQRPGEPEPFLAVPLASVRNVALDLDKQEVTVGEATTREGVVRIRRASHGEIDVLRLVPATPSQPSTQGAEASPLAPTAPTAGQGQAASRWTVNLTSASLDRYRIHVRDEVPPEPLGLTLEDVNLATENLSTRQGQMGKASLALRLGQGTVSGQGPVGMNPPTADLALTIKDLDIRPFQPYVAERVKVTIADGRVSTDGRVSFSMGETSGPTVGYAGNVLIARFAALEKASAEDLLRWDTLAVREITASSNPLKFHSKGVAISNFFAKIVMQSNGALNLQDLQEKGEQAASPPPSAGMSPAAVANSTGAAAPAPAEQPRDIQIDEVTLQGGRIQFSDRSVRPNYSANLSEIGGRVSGLSSQEATLAEVELRGKFGEVAPLEITGSVNPLKQDLYVDLRARFTGMDLSQTSPYSGKYAGYTIEKGKLSFDLTYKIDRRKLDSENKIFIDQFTFGEKVESPTATSLPVKLAVALLKDRNGEIHLDLPVAGSLDDPQFSVWPVIWQIIGNLITKAVTSPFALLGATFGGGEGLQYVEFDYGRATIPGEGARKIGALATALSEKPSLKLDIAGHVDPEADREGLKQYLLQRKVKAQKLKDLLKTGSAPSVDEITIEAGEYEKYLTLAYRAETFPKPRTFIGMVKTLPVPEMEKLILAHIEVGEEELHLLASQRANAVKEAILRSGKVEGERLFIVEPKTLAPEKKENLKDSRVEFTIS